MADSEIWVRSSRLDVIRAKLEQINRRADKKGLAGRFELQVIEERARRLDDSEAGRVILETRVSITGIPPRYDGWAFVAVIDHTLDEPVLTRVPQAPQPDLSGWRDRANRCDHCQAVRKRSQTFVVLHDDGRLMQVGRQCLRDFLGGPSGEAIAWAANAALDIAAGLNDEDGWGGGGGGTDAIESLRYLVWVAASIREDGWLSRTVARETGKCATADCALTLMFPGPSAKDRKDRIKRTDEDQAVATAALEWARAIDPGDPSDYLSSLGRVCRAEWVRPRHIGILASAISAHSRAMEQEIRRRAFARSAGESQHFGEAGQRLKWQAATKRKPAAEGLTLTVLGWSDHESNWGMTRLYRFQANGRDLAVTWASRILDVEQGKTYRADATIKGHERCEYKGTVYAQTTLTRVVILDEAKEARSTE